MACCISEGGTLLCAGGNVRAARLGASSDEAERSSQRRSTNLTSTSATSASSAGAERSRRDFGAASTELSAPTVGRSSQLGSSKVLV